MVCGATPRPSGENLEQQTARIITGIDAQLSDPTLATQGAWELVWLALSEANANMAYLARSTDGSNEFAVVARGTDADPTDILEDLDVGTVVPFPESGSPKPIAVSKGAKDAFTRVVNARSIASPSPNATLAQALFAALKAAPSAPQPTVYLTGHSLGGCIATMLAPYLQAQTWPPGPTPMSGRCSSRRRQPGRLPGESTALYASTRPVARMQASSSPVSCADKSVKPSVSSVEVCTRPTVPRRRGDHVVSLRYWRVPRAEDEDG
jgi:hypothetical protein